jgi:hypothetical protein
MVLPTVNWRHKQNEAGFKKSRHRSYQLLLPKLKEHCLTIERQAAAERICPFVEG